MLLTLRSQYTRLRTSPQPGASLAMPAASMLALLCFLRACAAEEASKRAALQVRRASCFWGSFLGVNSMVQAK